MITIPAGSTNVPVTSVTGFVVGEKIALGYGATYPAVARAIGAVRGGDGHRGRQAGHASLPRRRTRAAGSTNIKVTSVADISAGDKIRLDIDSVGHGIETVTVASVGTQATQTNLSADASAGATHIRVRSADGFAVGDKITVGTPANKETVTVTAAGAAGPTGAGMDFTPALAKAHIRDEGVVAPGTGLDLAAPLKFDPCGQPPLQRSGNGDQLPAGHGLCPFQQRARSGARRRHHARQAPGQGTRNRTRWCATPRSRLPATRERRRPTSGSAAPSSPRSVPFFDRTVTLREGSMVLRDASGLVVDSLNYGGLVDPWAAEGYQAASGSESRAAASRLRPARPAASAVCFARRRNQSPARAASLTALTPAATAPIS